MLKSSKVPLDLNNQKLLTKTYTHFKLTKISLIPIWFKTSIIKLNCSIMGKLSSRIS
jgi:hypothetical protein